MHAFYDVILKASQLLLPLSGIGALITGSIAGWKSLAEYRIKLKEEQRLANSMQIEADIKLVKHFTELMNIAHARSGYKVSDIIIEKMFENGFISDNDKQDIHALNNKIANACILTLPVGAAAQDAAIAAIFTLAKTHKILRVPAIQALESLKTFKNEVAEKFLTELISEEKDEENN